jgi:Arc/MetJ-type ribon-helix-helix transcriptional regulator
VRLLRIRRARRAGFPRRNPGRSRLQLHGCWNSWPKIREAASTEEIGTSGKYFAMPVNSCGRRPFRVCDLPTSGARSSMVSGMATTKITITLPDEQIREIRALVAAGEATSVSAFVKHAVGIALFDAAGWREMLHDALQQTGGPVTKKERAWANDILSAKPQKSGPRKRPAA